ncbi:MAG: class II fructose-bisphosphate aldolase, partial [Evtepia sp.]
MLVNMKYMLDNANRDGYAVMAVNSVNMEMVRAVIEAASEEHSPIIVQMGVGQMKKLAHPEDIVPLVINMAER